MESKTPNIFQYEKYYSSADHLNMNFILKESFVQRIIELGKCCSAGSIVDFGCGHGREALRIKQLTGWKVIGVDFSAEVLSKISKDIVAVLLNITEPLNESLNGDLAYSAFLIHLLSYEQKKRFYTNVAKVIKRNGFFIILTASFDDLEKRFLSKYFPTALEIDKKRYGSIEENTELLRESGFCDITMERILLGVINIAKDLDIYEKKGCSILKIIPSDEYRAGLDAMKKDFGDDSSFDSPKFLREWWRTLIIARKK